MVKSPPNWICCQLGAREHYAVPRALHQVGQLSTLITDAWVPPTSLFNRLPKQSLQERFHPELANATVYSSTGALLRFELLQRFQKTTDWSRMIARNHWFQSHAVRCLDKVAAQMPPSSTRPVLFAYSYAALNLLRYAKQKGWHTVLGQIDPGPMEEKLVLAEHTKHPDLAPDWQPVPAAYWQTWRAECDLADQILVNSDWSAQLLKTAGIDEHKISTVPLVYTPPCSAVNFTREYPTLFSAARPLRVLFLGLVTLRKGIAALLEAIRGLTGQPVEFWIVGTQQIAIPEDLRDHPQVRWVGPVSRSQTQHYYQQADVFLFPTLSDGFGLTQLEAQAWKLPMIASRACGNVVTDGVNGLVLPQVTGEAITQHLIQLLTQPERLTMFSQRAMSPAKYSLQNLCHHLQALTPKPMQSE